MIVGINYAPELISTAVYTTGLSEMLAEAGHEVHVVTALPYFPAWKVMEGWPKFRYRSERPHPNLTVTHCPLYVPANPTGARRILHHASFALSALPRTIWRAIRRRPDVVMVIAPSMMSAMAALPAARIAGAKTWLHIQDYEVEAAFATGLLKEQGRLGRAAKAFEAWTLRRFDRISSISDPMLAKLLEKGVARKKVFELRNWANLAKVIPVEGRSPMCDELGITTQHVALYSGNLANKQGLEIIPEAARLLAHRADLTFAVCGDGPLAAQLRSMSEGLPNIRFFPLQPLEKFSATLGMASVHLLPQIAGAADLVLPSKLTNMLASGRPVVATADPETALGREVEGCGRLTPPGDGPAFAQAIATLLDHVDQRQLLGLAARARAYERWDSSAIFARFEAELTRLVPHTEKTVPVTAPERLKDI